MRVEIFADFICPWCGIGVRRFEEALCGFERRDEVEVIRRAFQLNPQAEIGATEPSAAMLARRGHSPEAIEAMAEKIEEIGRASCRERVEVWVLAGLLKNTQTKGLA